ncbi:drug/metabolite transporter (DMT)-like permease [Microvirga flocculans]|uniref:Drug/metabolite transporter (DMT)-like permease n=1 Tax=Microvirga flocculans TaxID=217168 RepID=A0A7W6IHB0_9HYPH|nr:DMT family transporter [Microvirga flocculans]MBB4041156.1 drug/metabolite transporter (DMT)-like permease [Microvirga flocculans]
MKILHSIWQGIWGQAYLLLTLTALMWGGNAIAGRLAIGQVSPMVLTCLRWVIVVLVLLPLVGRQVVAEWPKIRERWLFTMLMGMFGFTAFNALFYAAAHHTTAVNLTIFQGSIPVLVLMGTVLFFHARVIPLQVLGMIVTLLGVVLVSVKADLHILKTLGLNIGDVWTLIACVLYAGYTLGLRHRPALPGLVFFAALAVVAFLTSLPLLALEIRQGAVQWPTPQGWLILLYVGLMPSLVSQVFFIRGVELIGPARAGLFVNLVPVFGALLAVLLLGEPFALYHALGLFLVLGGIWLAERK